MLWGWARSPAQEEALRIDEHRLVVDRIVEVAGKRSGHLHDGYRLAFLYLHVQAVGPDATYAGVAHPLHAPQGDAPLFGIDVGEATPATAWKTRRTAGLDAFFTPRTAMLSSLLR